MYTSRLCWRIEARDSYPLGGPIEVLFALENPGEQALWILTWLTPLEGLFGDFLRLELDGKPLEYRGPMVKRGEPDAEDYLLLPAGGELHQRLDLSLAYRFEVSGTVRLRLAVPLADAVGGGTAVPRVREQHREMLVRPAEVRFRVEVSRSPTRD